MKGFKDFVMRGNLVELAVAFIIGAAFAAVVTAFTKVIIELLAKAGGAPNFDKWQPGNLVSDGAYAVLTGRAGALLSRRRVRLVSRLGGAFLVGGGIWLALTRR